MSIMPSWWVRVKCAPWTGVRRAALGVRVSFFRLPPPASRLDAAPSPAQLTRALCPLPRPAPPSSRSLGRGFFFCASPATGDRRWALGDRGPAARGRRARPPYRLSSSAYRLRHANAALFAGSTSVRRVDSLSAAFVCGAIVPYRATALYRLLHAHPTALQHCQQRWKCIAQLQRLVASAPRPTPRKRRNGRSGGRL
jgi:hypothetical protein